MFGFRGFGARRGGLGGGLRSALITGAGMMAWRWWKNRQANRERNPYPVDRDSRQSYERGRTNLGGDGI